MAGQSGSETVTATHLQPIRVWNRNLITASENLEQELINAATLDMLYWESYDAFRLWASSFIQKTQSDLVEALKLYGAGIRVGSSLPG